MLEYIDNLLKEFNYDVKESEKLGLADEVIIDDLKNKIKESTNVYINTDSPEIKKQMVDNLIRCYNLVYYYKSKKDPRRMYLDLDLEKLPNVYLIDQRPERFEIDDELINSIDINEGLSYEQAIELLKWTSNNTRDNLSKSGTGYDDDVYNNASLEGACGFSQFSTLYPLKEVGLKVTVNNIRAINSGPHAYGTVTIPIREGDEIIDKNFIIDCTYRQFFTIPDNVVSRYLSNDCSPEAAFFINQDSKNVEFSKELLRNGFIEATNENLKMYLKPFYATKLSIDKIDKLDEEFAKLDIDDIINNRQEEFDYTYEEFCQWGLNLDINNAKQNKK